MTANHKSNMAAYLFGMIGMCENGVIDSNYENVMFKLILYVGLSLERMWGSQTFSLFDKFYTWSLCLKRMVPSVYTLGSRLQDPIAL